MIFLSREGKISVYKNGLVRIILSLGRAIKDFCTLYRKGIENEKSFGCV